MVSELGSEKKGHITLLFSFFVSVPKVFQCLCPYCSSCLCDLVKKEKKKEKKRKGDSVY